MYNRLMITLSGVLLFTFLVASSSQAKSGLDIIPHDAQMVFAVKMNKAKLNQILKNPKVKNEIAKIEHFGLNLSSVNEIHGSVNNVLNNKPDAIIVAEGKFSKDKVYSAVTKTKVGNKLSESSYSGVTYLKSQDENHYSIAVLGVQFFVVAKEKDLKLVIDLNNGKGRSVKQNSEITNNLYTVQDGNIFWLIALIPDSAKDKMVGDNKNFESLKDVKVLSLSYQFKSDDIIKINSICSSNDKTSGVQTAMKSFIDQMFAFGSMMLNNQEIAEINNKAEYSSKGNVATVKLTITKQQADTIMKALQSNK